MRKLKYPIGISDFAEMRNNGYYYIDKTNLIVDLLDKGPVEVTQITRPRRFGKTLGMSTLANFLDITKDSKQMFEGLAISQNTELCKKWMNQCPVVFFSFKDTDGLTFESAYGMLCMKLAFAFQDYQFLLDDDAISDDDKGIFKRILGRTASMDETKSCFLLLTRMLEIHFKKSAVVILDEYDVPIAKASSNGYYSQMLDVMRAMMSTTLKDNTSLDFAVITGCLKIAKESIFTGTNNFVSDTILSPRLSESFGFTQTDVDQMLKDAGLESQSAEIKAWYDGYHFGDADIYCPWDVISYLRDFQYGVSQKPKSYWKNTSDNAIIRSFIDYMVVFDSVSRMSRNAEEGFALYEDLYRKGIQLVFLKEHHIDTETYKKALSGSIAMTGTNVDFILKGINEYLMALAKEQIKLAFEQSEKEVADLHQRTREGLLTARLNGKQVGRKKGVGFETKKAREAKQIIRTHCKTFGGTLDDAECMKLTGLARNTYYKYKRQIRAELMAEQDLPKGASIFYEPPKSF